MPNQMMKKGGNAIFGDMAHAFPPSMHGKPLPNVLDGPI
jgi:hypothetical protein